MENLRDGTERRAGGGAANTEIGTSHQADTPLWLGSHKSKISKPLWVFPGVSNQTTKAPKELPGDVNVAYLSTFPTVTTGTTEEGLKETERRMTNTGTDTSACDMEGTRRQRSAASRLLVLLVNSDTTKIRMALKNR